MLFNLRKKKYLKMGPLEVDEILFDSHQLGSRDLKWENRIEKPVLSFNIKIFGAVIFFIVSIAAFRSAHIVFADGQIYSEKARSNYVKEVCLLFPVLKCPALPETLFWPLGSLLF